MARALESTEATFSLAYWLIRHAPYGMDDYLDWSIEDARRYAMEAHRELATRYRAAGNEGMAKELEADADLLVDAPEDSPR